MKKMLCLIAALALLLCGCGKGQETQPAEPEFTVELSSADFAEGSHKRSEDYLAAFKTRTLALDGISINIAENVFDETLSPEMAEDIATGCHALRSFDPERASGVEIYVVSMTTTGGPVLLGSRLYVTDAFVESGEYLPWLASCIYGIDDWWRCVGVSLAISGEETDVADLAAEMKEHFASLGNSHILSLHPCWFLEEFADESTRDLAGKMARALTEYIISEESFGVFLENGIDVSYRRAWLESLGLQYDLSWLEAPAAERMAAMSFSTTEDVPLALEERDFRLNMHCLDWLPDANAAYTFLLDFCSGADKLYKRFEAEAPEFCVYLRKRGLVTAVQFHQSDYPISSRASMLKAEAVVTDDADVLHEICHTLMPRATIEEAYWLCEGLVTYLTAPHVSYYADSIVVDSVLKEYEGDTEEDRALRAETVRCFEKLNNCNISAVYDMEQPIYKIYEATGYAAFLNPDNNSMPAATQSIKDSYGERLGNSIKGAYPGNELSYLEAMLFTEWLVDKYGLETVIAAQMFKDSYFELFPNAAAFEEEFAEFWAARVAPLEK